MTPLIDALAAHMTEVQKRELNEILGGDAQWKPGEWERIWELLTPKQDAPQKEESR